MYLGRQVQQSLCEKGQFLSSGGGCLSAGQAPPPAADAMALKGSFYALLYNDRLVNRGLMFCKTGLVNRR